MVRVLSVVGAFAGVVLCLPTDTRGQVPLPTDVKPTCVVTPQQFNSWFASGKVSPNGVVKPADSVGFTLDPKNPHCSFYQWSEQMFLWLTSPAPGGHVFTSPIFFNVDAGTGAVSPNTPERVIRLGVRDLQPGPRGKRLIRGRDGTLVEDETGQAGGGGTLMAQNGSLIYYSIHINDVYAYFKTGSNQNAFNPPITHFPTTQAELDQIVAFARSLGVTLPDAQALTLEIKTSWVEASSVDAGKYVTMTATIPTYDFSKPPVPIPGTNPQKFGWQTGAPKTTKMALIGMHVVGPVKGHPEMVWATFEHAENAPNNTYQYTAADGSTKTVPFRTAPPPGVKNWLLCASNAPPDPSKLNQEILVTSSNPPGWIVQNQKAAQNASSTVRTFPWGVAAGAKGVPDATEILSINNSVLTQLAPGDTRRNYPMIGAVWTGGTVPPNEKAGAADAIGSTMLANATMETYNQTINCFACHNGDPLGTKDPKKGSLSHIWANMQSLPPAKK